MQNFTELANACRTVHAFEPGGVDERDMLEALENALKAPNHRFTFPWHFVWAGPKEKELLARLSAELKGKSFEELEEVLAKKMLNPELVVFCQKVVDDEFQSKEDYASLACAAQLFALSLAEKKIGYKWSTGQATREERAYKILNIDPKEYEIVGFLYAGVAANPPKERRRPQLQEVLTRLG